MYMKCPGCNEKTRISFKVVFFDKCPLCGGRVDQKFNEKIKTIRIVLHVLYLFGFIYVSMHLAQLSNMLNIHKLIFEIIGIVLTFLCYMITEIILIKIAFR